jgi:hypothetical protein
MKHLRPTLLRQIKSALETLCQQLHYWNRLSCSSLKLMLQIYAKIYRSYWLHYNTYFVFC